jgi:glycosyltransferase involved in cell wall biosynthesis
MQLLWIGCVESDGEFEKKARKGYDLASAQVSQKNLINGIEQASGLIFDSINGSALPPYPVYADRIIESAVWSHTSGAFDISVGYKNDKYVNRIRCKKAMLQAAERWVKDRYNSEELKVFVYSMRSSSMATACYIKKKIPTAKIYLIITDLPQFMDLGQSKVKAALKKIDWISIKKMQKKFDGFILYASKMAEYLNIPDDKWLLMEGSYDNKEATDVVSVEKKKAIMYSGKLDKQYGIPMLLDAFMGIIDPDAELWITGGGNAEDYIKKCASKDKRIRFYGFLPSREDVLNLQKQASMLVNMRLPSETASAYCFPSKIFEYMATGVPVISFKLEGIPEEYYQYLCLISSESEESVRETIRATFDMKESELRLLGEKAQQFVFTKKNSNEQSKRIWKYVN